MDAHGYVTDYTLTNGALASTGSMDSTDSYAGTFLLAARDAYRVSKDLTRLKSLKKGVGLAVSAIESTQQSDGLTWAKPSWLVKYLMDQAEAYGGLLAAKSIAGWLGDAALTSRVNTDATRMLQGVGKLWNTLGTAYDWAVQSDGSHVSNDWTFLYPDALEQAWAVAFGLADGNQSAVMTRFLAAQPAWAKPAGVALFRGGTDQNVGYWPVAGMGLYRVASVAAATAGVSGIRTAALAVARAWPFTTGNAGQLILFEASALTGALTFDGKALPKPVLRSTRVTSTPAPTPTRSPAPTPTPTPAPTPASTPTPSPSPAPTETPAPTPTPLLPIPTLLP
jgi:hypothetical protein